MTAEKRVINTIRLIANVVLILVGTIWIADRVTGNAPEERGIVPILGTIPSAFQVAEAAGPIESGPFTYKYQPGEALVYQLVAVASGDGFDAGTPGGVYMNLSSDLILYTEDVDRYGNATMLATFDNLQLTGNYMGDDVQLYKRDGNTSFNMGGHTTVNTALGDSIDGIPQLEFYNEPIRMKISPVGEVLEVDGPKGFDQLLSPSDMLSMASFPSANLQEGDQWESEFNLPVPGLDTPPKAKTLNTFTGYTTIAGRYCGVIRQEFLADQVDGSISSPKSKFGDAMGFTMPTFTVTGTNMIYFDVDNGQLVYTEIELDVGLEIGEELKPAAAMLGVINSLLTEIEGGKKAPRSLIDTEDPLHELSVHISGTLALVI